MDVIADNLTLDTTATLNTTSDVLNLSVVNLSHSFQFWFLLCCEIPSLICYLFVFIYIFTRKAQRRALPNHSLLVLLVIAFLIVLFDYSWTADSNRHEGQVWLATPAFCQVWWLLDIGFFNACTVVLAWISFERHILIFYSALVRTKRKRLYVHYLPLIFILLYLILFYISVIFFPPCENQYDYISAVCGAYPCYFTNIYLAMWDTIVHGIIPTILILLFNIALLVRVVWKKYCQLGHQNWKKYRKMTFELLSVAALYLSVNLPFMIIFMVQSSGYPNWGVQVQRYVYFFSTLAQFLLPFICTLHLPGIWLEIKTCVLRNHRRVNPIFL